MILISKSEIKVYKIVHGGRETSKMHTFQQLVASHSAGSEYSLDGNVWILPVIYI